MIEFLAGGTRITQIFSHGTRITPIFFHETRITRIVHGSQASEAGRISHGAVRFLRSADCRQIAFHDPRDPRPVEKIRVIRVP